MNGVRELGGLVGLFFATLSTVALAEEPQVVPERPPTDASSVAVESGCVPACRTGYVCNQGTCVSLCNPPCASNEVCTAAGQCLQLTPAAATGAAVAVPPASGYASPTPNAVVLAVPAEEKPRPSSAPLGKGLNVIFSAENLFGLEVAWETDTPTKSGGSTVSGHEYDSYSENSVFFGNARTVNLEPRLGVDVSINGFTIGGTLMYASHSGDQTSKSTGSGLTSSTSTTTKDPDFSTAGAGVRAGFVTMFTNTVGIWPRLGLSYRYESRTYTADTTSTTTSPYSTLNSSADWVFVEPEMMLVLSPVSHFGILVGVGGNVSVTGGYKTTYTMSSTGETTTEGDLSNKSLHLSVGLAGYI